MKIYNLRLLCIAFTLLLFSEECISQDLYVITGYSIPIRILRINSDNSTTLITEIPYDPNSVGSFTDIAISSSNTFYGIKSGGHIYEINTTTGATNLLVTLPDNGSYTSLVCNSSDELYAINNSTQRLIRYNIQTNTVEDIAYLGSTTPGDITFYNGNIIFPSYDATINRGVIKAFNLTDESIINGACIPEATIADYGIANVHTDCSLDRVFTINSVGDLCEYDFINDTRICTNINFGYSILGMASSSEHIASNCGSENLVDAACQPMSVSEYSKEKIKIYPNPAKDILRIENRINITAIEFFNVSGKKIKEITNPNSNINIENLTNGVYFLKVHSNRKIEVVKFIKE